MPKKRRVQPAGWAVEPLDSDQSTVARNSDARKHLVQKQVNLAAAKTSATDGDAISQLEKDMAAWAARCEAAVAAQNEPQRKKAKTKGEFSL